MHADSDGIIWENSKSKNITRFGKFLRKISLDNLSNGYRDAVLFGEFVEGDIAE